MGLPPGFSFSISGMNLMSNTAHAKEPITLHEPTIGELRKTRFLDLPIGPQIVAGYLEQLASQTGTNIDNWPFSLFALLSCSDRRAINRAFFAQAEKSVVGIKKISVETEAALTETKLKIEETQKAQLLAFTQIRDANIREASGLQNRIGQYMQAGWNAQREIYALEKRGASYIADDLKRVLAEGFWEFHKYENSIVMLATKNDVIMSEVNPTAGIERRVNLGKYLAHYYVKTTTLQVHRHQQNAIAGGHWHPYINSNGNICWGNAATSATALLTKGQLYEVFSLLASLLMTYSPTATPYQRLLEFAALKTRANSDEPFKKQADPIECPCCGSDNPDDCDCCRECEAIREDCNCCSICENSNRDECDCCQNCERTDSHCSRCRACHSHDDGCDCCAECGRTETALIEEGHASHCESFEEEEEEAIPTPETTSAPLDAIPAAPAEDDLPF